MHEVSLVRNIFRTLEAEFGPERLPQVTAIHLQVGKMSNVEPILMRNAFWAVLEDNPAFAHMSLEMDVTPILIECPQCRTQTEVTNYVFRCRSCETPTNNIISGTELLIHKVEFAD